MQPVFLTPLRGQRARIRHRWEDLLRAEGYSSPLADPDTLVHLIDHTLDELLASLAAADPFACRSRPTTFECPCSRNPLLVYFSAGRRATQEALALAQAAMPGLTSPEHDASVEALEAAFSKIASREIASFCAVCQYRTERVWQKQSILWQSLRSPRGIKLLSCVHENNSRSR